MSGINGNIYVPFLGGLGAAMPPGYPVGDTATCSPLPDRGLGGSNAPRPATRTEPVGKET